MYIGKKNKIYFHYCQIFLEYFLLIAAFQEAALFFPQQQKKYHLNYCFPQRYQDL